MKQKVAVGLSGGVDSAVSALILKQMGNEVVGVHLYCWPPKSEVEKDGITREEWIKKNGCRADEDREMALKTALELGIQFKVLDFSEEYNSRVIKYFYDEYEKGRTPNPDVMCNSEIKFGLFLEWALENGFDFIATGHYARKLKKNSSFSFDDSLLLATDNPASPAEAGYLDSRLKFSPSEKPSNLSLRSMAQKANHLEDKQFLNNEKFSTDSRPTEVLSDFYRLPIRSAMTESGMTDGGKEKFNISIPADEHKDQTYFLWKLTQKELAHVLFPLGEYKKPTVRKMAVDAGLSVAGRPDSQGICFVGSVDVREFLQRRLKPKVGVVSDVKGEVVGEHDGVWFYTIGQRGGWRMSAKAQKKYTEDEETPVFYVVSKNAEKNELVVGRAGEVERKEFEVSEVNWIGGESLVNGNEVVKMKVRIRHGGELMNGKVQKSGSGLKVILENEVRGVASGQSAVFYSDDGEMLGGGVIG